MAAGPEQEGIVVVSETGAGQTTTTSTHGDAVGDAAFAKRVLRKIDTRLVPLLFITYGLNFMDKTILSSASVFGLRNDTVCFHSVSSSSFFFLFPTLVVAADRL